MAAIDILQSTLTSPLVLAFVLGVVGPVAGSDLRLPKAIVSGLSTYLLFAIGLTGGVAPSATSLGEIAVPALAVLALGVITPVVAFLAALRLLPIGRVDASALAAHYGSVSAVTFAAALAVFEGSGVPVEPFAPALLAMLVVALPSANVTRASRPSTSVRGGANTPQTW